MLYENVFSNSIHHQIEVVHLHYLSYLFHIAIASHERPQFIESLIPEYRLSRTAVVQCGSVYVPAVEPAAPQREHTRSHETRPCQENEDSIAGLAVLFHFI